MERAEALTKHIGNQKPNMTKLSVTYILVQMYKIKLQIQCVKCTLIQFLITFIYAFPTICKLTLNLHTIDVDHQKVNINIYFTNKCTQLVPIKKIFSQKNVSM